LKRARVILADDHADFLAVVTRLLEPEFEVVKTVSNGQALVDAVDTLDPDLAVLDVCMPVLNGIEAAQRLQTAGSRTKLVMLSVHGDPDYVHAAHAVGAHGYVVKCRLASDLVVTLREALAGGPFTSPSIAMG
jgi:DNA-binding NarL/FixJ family response regulator